MKNKFWNPSVRGGPKLLHGSIGTYRKTKKMKILIMYRLWSKCVPMNLKRTPMTFKIKLTHNFGPLSCLASLLASDTYFHLKWPYFVYLAV